MSEADRREAQEALHRLRYYQGPVDGIFGPLTRAAMRSTTPPDARRGQNRIGP
jgi:peptidoglycan hydrolase-like protein with peptidoglycan-binding domain